MVIFYQDLGFLGLNPRKGAKNGTLIFIRRNFRLNNIRIGYLNRQVEENIEVYKKMYDIVLVRDETLDIPIKITKYCFSH